MAFLPLAQGFQKVWGSWRFKGLNTFLLYLKLTQHCKSNYTPVIFFNFIKNWVTGWFCWWCVWANSEFREGSEARLCQQVLQAGDDRLQGRMEAAVCYADPQKGNSVVSFEIHTYYYCFTCSSNHSHVIANSVEAKNENKRKLTLPLSSPWITI